VAVADPTRARLEELYDRAVEICAKHRYVSNGKPKLKLLCSSASVFPSTTGLLILGANPGGGEAEHRAEDPRRPFEDSDYCAYLDESWMDGAGKWISRGQHRIQLRIRRVVEALLESKDEDLVKKVVRSSPAGNILPFRSREWVDLPVELRSRTTCDTCRLSHFEICADLVKIAQPRLIVTIGGSSEDIGKALKPLGQMQERPQSRVPIWSTWKYREYEILGEDSPIMVVALPAVNSQRMDEPRFLRCLNAISLRRSMLPPLGTNI